MPNTTDRPSLTTGLIGKYKSGPAGGAFDARNITLSGHAPLINSFQSRKWTPAGFKTKMGATEFTRPEGSMYLKGHDTRKYTGKR